MEIMDRKLDQTIGPIPEKPKVMVVEDEIALLHSVAFTLKRYGFEAHMCTGGDEAFREIMDASDKNDPFDVLVTDIQVNGISGIDLIKSIRDRNVILPSVVMTAYGSKEIRERLKVLEVSDILDKPFDIDELVRRVNAIIAFK